jgi:hypothetical protein
VEDGNGYDVVAMDDIIYSEPQAVAGALVSASQPKKVGQAIRPTDAIVATATTTGTQEMGVGNEVIATEMPVSEVPPDEFLLNFDDAGEKRLASLSVDLTGLPPAPEGKTYVVWLADYNHNYLLAGEAIPGQVFIYVEPGGKNLISRFRGAVLSLEDREALQANSIQAPTEIHYTGEIPAEILPLIQKLVVAAPDTPGNNPYGYGLQEQAAIGKHHAEVLVEALKGGDLAAAKTHMEHLGNTMVGFHSPDYGDMNGDGKAENYGDGFGTLLYAARVVSILDQITELQGLNDHYRQGAVKAAQCTRSIANKLGPEIKEKGRTIFTATEADSAIQVGEVIVSAVDTLALGFDVDGNGTVDPAEGECGAAQVYDLVHRLYHIHMAHDTQGQHEH